MIGFRDLQVDHLRRRHIRAPHHHGGNICAVELVLLVGVGLLHYISCAQWPVSRGISLLPQHRQHLLIRVLLAHLLLDIADLSELVGLGRLKGFVINQLPREFGILNTLWYLA